MKNFIVHGDPVGLNTFTAKVGALSFDDAREQMAEAVFKDYPDFDDELYINLVVDESLNFESHTTIHRRDD